MSKKKQLDVNTRIRLSESLRKTAVWLLKHSANQPEDAIRQRIGSLLDSLNIEYELSYRSPYATGPCDIYLPRRRTIIETKSSGLANEPETRRPSKSDESPKQQLERYIHAEIEYELDSLPEDSNPSRPWIGIVTDGVVWHTWRYPHESQSVGSSVAQAFHPPDPESLVDHISHYLDSELIGKPWIPVNPRDIFAPFQQRLIEIYERMPSGAASRTRTKKELWLEMLRTSSMAPANEIGAHRLFVAHSFLVALARGVINELAMRRETPNPTEVLASGFVAWVLDSQMGVQWANELFEEINRYEWRRRPGDVLRPLYEHFVDASDRKGFGEFYTPDWLAELLVREVCDEPWCDQAIDHALIAMKQQKPIEKVGVLDPTCGSGTFLYHAALKILQSTKMNSLSKSDKSAVLCALVNGIDVHPVAAEIARATLLRALPTEPPQGEASIRIHQGDALMIHDVADETSLFRPRNGEIQVITPKGREILIPRNFVERASFVDDLRRLVWTATRESELPYDIQHYGGAQDKEEIIECHRQLTEIIRKEGDSVWTWFIHNITGPYRLAETKVDRIVANPPWVKLADIQVRSRKRSLEQFAQDKEIGLWAGGKQAPHFDIAQLFIKRCRALYMNEPDQDPAAWLVKKSAIGGGNWELFREWHQSILQQSLDLEKVQPFGNGDARRCCVLFETRKSTLSKCSSNQLIAKLRYRTKPKPNDQLEDVLESLLISAAPTRLPKKPSDYNNSDAGLKFRQGAIITPKVLTVTNKVQQDTKSTCLITTEKSLKRPWSTLNPQTGTVPKSWLRNLLISKAVLPFSSSPSEVHWAIVPTGKDGNLDKHAAEKNSFWNELEQIYQDYRGKGKSTPQTLTTLINYHAALSAQLRLNSARRTMVVYPSSGDIMRSCRLQPTDIIIDSTLYWLVASNAKEAAYLTAILNAPCLNDAFVQARTSGRDFHLNPWRCVPIPRFDSEYPNHTALASLTVRAERAITTWFSRLEDSERSLGQVALSTRIRKLLSEKGIFDEINTHVRKILPKQSR